MIRLLLVIFLPLMAPYVAWYGWKIFLEKPKIDPVTGDQIAPDIRNAPRGKLLLAAVALLIVTVSGFLLSHDRIGSDPYRPLTVDEFEKQQRAIPPEGADNK